MARGHCLNLQQPVGYSVPWANGVVTKQISVAHSILGNLTPGTAKQGWWRCATWHGCNKMMGMWWQQGKTLGGLGNQALPLALSVAQVAALDFCQLACEVKWGLV